MATSTEIAFFNAVAAAESIRQTAKSAAFTTYAFVPASYTTYKTALADADVAYYTSVNTARDTSNLTLGTLGNYGPIDVAQWASLTGMY